MKDLFKLILGVPASLFKSRARLEAEILILRQQINVLRRHFLRVRQRISAEIGNFGSNPGTPETGDRAKSRVRYLRAFSLVQSGKSRSPDWLAGAAGFELRNSLFKNAL
jgi:hypothetical protein